jgi:hypothetical protein
MAQTMIAPARIKTNNLTITLDRILGQKDASSLNQHARALPPPQASDDLYLVKQGEQDRHQTPQSEPA